jgi:hypothetical protein
MRLAAGVALAALIGLGGEARANDSTANYAAGGLVLTKTAAIEMRSESLYISTSAVRVKYSFLNTSAKDVTVTVAFPVPDMDQDGPEPSVDIPNYNSPNFLGFVTTVDGKPVQMQIEQKALQKGVDRTAYLKSLGLPASPFYDATSTVLNKLPTAQQDALIKQGLAMVIDDAQGSQPRQLMPTWTLKTTYFWTQTFPAGQAVAIEHDYTPSVGSSAVFAETPAAIPVDDKQYCVDADIIAAVRKATPAGEQFPSLGEQYVDYVLVTGANWAAPIGDFQMTVDKGAAANLVSFCGTGVVKTGPTTFSVHYTNFTPKSNVAVLILSPLPAN